MIKKKAIDIDVFVPEYEEDLVTKEVKPVLPKKAQTKAYINLKYIVETHLDPSGVFAYVNLSTGQVFMTSPSEYKRITEAMGFEHQS